MVEAGLRLQKAGCQGVGVASSKLQLRWRKLRKEAQLKRSHLDRTLKLRRR